MTAMGYEEGAIHEPVDRALQRVLRRAVLDHARGERRRHYPPVLHAGVPGVRCRRYVVPHPSDGRLDHALRTDVVEAMVRPALDRGVVPLLWLTRRGDTEPHDVDHEWSAAVHTAGG